MVPSCTALTIAKQSDTILRIAFRLLATMMLDHGEKSRMVRAVPRGNESSLVHELCLCPAADVVVSLNFTMCCGFAGPWKGASFLTVQYGPHDKTSQMRVRSGSRRSCSVAEIQ
jgi:hypothetical protein